MTKAERFQGCIIGGDTDTNCSIAGQIMGALIGRKGIPEGLMDKLKQLKEYEWIERTVHNFLRKENWG